MSQICNKQKIIFQRSSGATGERKGEKNPGAAERTTGAEGERKESGGEEEGEGSQERR